MALLSGLVDRYCLATSHCVNANAVVVIASFQGTAETLIPTIQKNTPTLLRTFPLLGAVVVDRATRNARFAASKRITATRIVDQKPQTAASLEEIFHNEHHRNGTELDPEQGPLWRVAFYDKEGSLEPTCYVALSCSHVINDGLGICELLRQLLRRPEINEKVERSTLKNQFPPRLEDTVDIPTPWHWLRDGWLHSAASMLPSFLNPYAPAPPSWPMTVSKRPIDCGIKRIILGDDHDSPGWLGSGLKSFSKISGAGSVNSIVHGAIAYSLYLATKEHDKTLPADLRFKSITPISIRSKDLGHPTTTGNYINVGHFSFSASDLSSADFTVHNLLHNYHAWMHSPTGRHVARNATGMMRFFTELDYNRITEWIPFYPSVKPEKLGNWLLSEPPTAYERFIMRSQNLTFDAEGKAKSTYSSAFQLSNTGMMKTGEWDEELRERLRGMWWAQRPMPWGECIFADVMGCEVLQTKVSDNDDTDSAYSTASDSSGDEPTEVVQNHLGISLSWRDGAVDNRIVEDSAENLRAMLNLLAAAGHQGKLATSVISTLPIQDFGRRLKESMGTKWTC
ncbi:hypothetical protein AC578_4245 [Pseudocercospora eumusae]|uniref:Condensation domain-containing protein n=1 Tax=Pseudocercospora eumusae TaxID=321146 RepID=A0A139HAQ7_9PEZI|nr:hypothetical protein AC578_4245 [Pseudocercospora eumusae]KXS99526.1 hypothetical protein AC578_4245 [Pseudocercospora eumusae]KXS99527.1 hypothetical protein AC578_4245 [Pseudocercospora eumusae]KXS99528.1 hypothetical protein AC578_4245 [Pseudocercospora eumusae]